MDAVQLSNESESGPTVVGVLGALRSGTTIIGEHLAANTGGVHVGELHLLWDRIATNRMCGCGELVAECPFWSAIWADIHGAGLLERPEDGVALWRSVVRMRRAFLGRSDAADRERFRTLTDALYAAVSEATGRKVIIDSSKHPGYFAVLSSGANAPSIVHVVRDARAVAYSWSVPKADADQPGGAMAVRSLQSVAGEWMGINALSTLITRRHPNAVRARYEDVARYGVGRMITTLGLPESSDETERWPHVVAGNPIRNDAARKQLVLDTRWTTAMARPRRLAVTAATSPFLVLYKYPLW